MLAWGRGRWAPSKSHTPYISLCFHSRFARCAEGCNELSYYNMIKQARQYKYCICERFVNTEFCTCSGFHDEEDWLNGNMPKQSSANLNAALSWAGSQELLFKRKTGKVFYFMKKIGFLPVAVALSRSKLEIALLRLRQRNGSFSIRMGLKFKARWVKELV